MKYLTNKTILLVMILCFCATLFSQGTPGLLFEAHPTNHGELQVSIGTAHIHNISIIIPGTYNGMPVTRIRDQGFQWLTTMASVTLPNSVTSIGWGAFRGCTGLTSITIPSSISSISVNPFQECINITNITVQAGNTFYRVEGNSLIRNSDNTLISGFSNTVIPNTITTIGDWAFRRQTGLTSITFPNSVTSIGDYAF